MKKISHLSILALILIKAIQCVHLQQTPEEHNKNIFKPNTNPYPIEQVIKFYRNDSEIQTLIDSLVSTKSDILIRKKQCQNDQSYNYVQIELLPDEQKQKKNVVITCNIHAREILVTEVCLHFIQNIKNSSLKDQGSDRLILNQQFVPEQIINFLREVNLKILYRGNDQRDKVIDQGQYCVRKNRNNIDLNRNFPTGFSKGNTDQQYPGDQPLSEPFSKCIDGILSSLNQSETIDTFIDIHTGQFTFFDSFSDHNSYRTQQLLKKVKSKYCPQCRVSSLGDQSDDQPANGQLFADVKYRYKVQNSVLIEIYGGYNAKQQQNQGDQALCFTIFNPITKQELDYFKDKWANALMYFLKLTLSISRSQ